ncbi:uncharacterized protein ACJ7VT_011647 [Polymixia lowei]
MDGVLEGAAVLCVCKLACSLLFLPSVTGSSSPVSVCCCCLLIFTDFLVTTFLTLLWIADSWLPQLSPASDDIALRFLLFLSHTYGEVLLFITPLIAVETAIRLLWPYPDTGGTTDVEECQATLGQRSHAVTVAVEDREQRGDDTDEDPDKWGRLSHAVGYLCCLSVWIFSGLNVRSGWKLEELWVVTCIHASDSLVACLPNLLSGPVPGPTEPCWGLAFLSLLLFLTLGMDVRRRHQASAQTEQPTRTHGEKHGANNSHNSGWRHLVPVLVLPSETGSPGTPAAEPTQSVDPEKTQSSCTVNGVYCWNSMQMSPRHHGDFDPLSLESLSADSGGQEHQRGKRGVPIIPIGIPIISIIEGYTESLYRSQYGWRHWGFPCLGVNVMTGLVGMLSVFVLPLNLSVNILLIQTIETILELFIKSLISLQQRQRSGQSLKTYQNLSCKC